MARSLFVGYARGTAPLKFSPDAGAHFLFLCNAISDRVNEGDGGRGADGVRADGTVNEEHGWRARDLESSESDGTLRRRLRAVGRVSRVRALIELSQW